MVDYFLQRRPAWVKDENRSNCATCPKEFDLIERRHHCRNCGDIFCADCSNNLVSLPNLGYFDPERVCNACKEMWDLNPPVDDPRVERYWVSRDGTRMYSRVWPAEGGEVGRVVLVHGLAEHANNYHAWATALATAGWAVYAYDQKGHGRTQGPRLISDNPHQFVDDLLSFADMVGPAVLMGHSFGSLVSIAAALERPQAFTALITTGTYTVLPQGASPLLVNLSKVVASVAPLLPIAKIDNTQLSHDGEYTARAVSDPYRGGAVPAGMAAGMASLVAAVQPRLAALTLPLLALHGQLDTIIPPAGTTTLFNSASSPNKTHRIFPGMYHEILNEVGKEEVWNFILDWLKKLHSDLHPGSPPEVSALVGENQ